MRRETRRQGNGLCALQLAYAPDRLSRKYAYQIRLIEELARNGVETLFVKAPHHQGAFPAAGQTVWKS
jgi:DNA invertase Pin-like site-specific DNA recombinase